MDVRQGMALPGSAPNYLSRVGSGSHPNAHSDVGRSPIHQHQTTSSFKNPINPFQSNVNHSTSSASFHLEKPSAGFDQTVTTTNVPSSEPLKKKRGRPRKYGVGGSVGGANMALGLSPLSTPTPSSGEKGRRGRPPGTGWKQKLAPLGGWMNSSAGFAFTPHVLHVGVGEDVAGKILAFAQQRPRALCIISANGSVSAVTLRQPTNSGGTIEYEGHFEILCLSGSYLVIENGGQDNRTGGISISVCSPDGLILGGAIGGKLIAANPVQVVACSFVYGNAKAKNKSDSGTKGFKFETEHGSKNSYTPVTTATSSLSFSPESGPSVWPLLSRSSEIKHSQMDIDLTHG